MRYDKQIESMINKINSNPWDFKIAMVADSHLDNSLDTTIANIKKIDQHVKFDCLVHLGDFMNGNLPRECTKKLLKEQMEIFQCAIEEKTMYPVQGNHDGYMDLYTGKNDIVLDEDWNHAIEFLDKNVCVIRENTNPYYYVDIPEKKVRLIILCSFFIHEISKNKEFGIHEEQLKWLECKALKVESDWTLMFFSHDTPFSNFDNDELVLTDNDRINGTRVLETILKTKDSVGFSIAGWFIGHFHGDLIKKVHHIPFVLISSETAYVPQLWKMEKGGYFPERILGTDTEDLWDAVCLDKKNRVIKMFRCGAGKDREIHY